MVKDGCQHVVDFMFHEECVVARIKMSEDATVEDFYLVVVFIINFVITLYISYYNK